MVVEVFRRVDHSHVALPRETGPHLPKKGDSILSHDGNDKEVPDQQKIKISEPREIDKQVFYLPLRSKKKDLAKRILWTTL